MGVPTVITPCATQLTSQYWYLFCVCNASSITLIESTTKILVIYYTNYCYFYTMM